MNIVFKDKEGIKEDKGIFWQSKDVFIDFLISVSDDARSFFSPLEDKDQFVQVEGERERERRERESSRMIDHNRSYLHFLPRCRIVMPGKTECMQENAIPSSLFSSLSVVQLFSPSLAQYATEKET